MRWPLDTTARGGVWADARSARAVRREEQQGPAEGSDAGDDHDAPRRTRNAADLTGSAAAGHNDRQRGHGHGVAEQQADGGGERQREHVRAQHSAEPKRSGSR